MRLTILDGRMMYTRQAAHTYLAKELQLPDYYGRNLDALADCLSEMSPDDYILLQHAEDLTDRLREYGDRMLDVFTDACAAGGPTVIVLY
ncbi:MAG: barstar family protein [Lachnospiraceae bacterium]|nr:barstar family protein [Lachnospiraceae bacterium]